jgi:ubiquitin-conjugating enzyme E2 O
MYFGQFVKRNMTDAMSGTVTRIWSELTLRPSFPGAMSGGILGTPRAPWPADEGSPAAEIGEYILEKVPAEEVVLAYEFLEGDYIIYNSWLGMVEAVIEEVTLRLGNGSVVVVEDPTMLETPILSESIHRPPGTVTGPHSSKTILADRVAVGQHVVTQKGNLRRGAWKYGAFDPSITPHGYVVDVRTVSIEVYWLGQNPMVPGRFVPVPRPPTELNSDILDSGQVRRYDSGRVPLTSSGTELSGVAHMTDLQCGDRVRFRDLAGAIVKYDGSTFTADGHRRGKLVKIPRTMSQGYDVNTFVVIETKTVVNVLWQDLIETREDGTALVPYQNTDDHDVWPGEIVAMKEEVKGCFIHGLQTESSSGEDAHIFRPKRVGVVQSVNPLERMAKVKWFVHPELEMIGKLFAFLILPGSKLGALSDAAEDVSLYELLCDPTLTINRGDFVLVAPPADFLKASDGPLTCSGYVEGVINASSSSCPGAIKQLGMVSPDNVRLLRQVQHNSANRYAIGASSDHGIDPSNLRTDIITTCDSPIDWFGEVVELGLDGFVTVRLGALDQVRDIVVPAERLTVIEHNDDGDDTEDDESSSVDGNGDLLWSSRDSEESNSEEAIEEVEYEGGQRWDSDGGDEMWTTETEDEADESSDVVMADESADSNSAIPLSNYRSDRDEKCMVSAHQVADGQHQETPASGVKELQIKSPLGAKSFDAYLHKPPQFAVLDSSPPTDHAFIAKPADLPAGNARRIRKEHNILETSLPNGIFVRAWESRIDLLRVLIIGPRNTPYELAPFVLDFQFSSTFPATPPLAYFHSWTGGIGRVNPNLYEDGKVCLSLLGTWPGQTKNEAWSSTRSSMLQILVSLMGLVLVKEPFYSKFSTLYFMLFYPRANWHSVVLKP